MLLLQYSELILLFVDGVSQIEMASAPGKHLEEKFFPKNVALDHNSGGDFVLETQIRVAMNMPGEWAQYVTNTKADDDTMWGYF